MSTLIIEVYEAFLAAGVPEDKARAAARTFSDDQNASKGDIEKVRIDIAKLDKEVAVMKWMLGVIVAGMATLILKAFFPHM
jgi:hypothetical protein